MESVKKGDTANIRTIPLKYRASGALNAGMAMEVKTSISDKIYIVRVIQKRSLLELLAFICGIAAGFIIIA